MQICKFIEFNNLCRIKIDHCNGITPQTMDFCAFPLLFPHRIHVARIVQGLLAIIMEKDGGILR